MVEKIIDDINVLLEKDIVKGRILIKRLKLLLISNWQRRANLNMSQNSTHQFRCQPPSHSTRSLMPLHKVQDKVKGSATHI